MVEDRIAAGIAAGWDVRNGAVLDGDLHLEADVAIVGSGAGGGISAELLAEQGLKVVLIEEGPLRSSHDFNMEERKAYADLYQEYASRKTKDKAISILQGRCVGGGTTVNWTSSFATPERTLNHWTRDHGVLGCEPEQMAPWFEKIRNRLFMGPWSMPPNANNEALRKGAEKLGWSHGLINRNVRGCANLGYCGVGCPLDAKQSMLVTTVPAALAHGATLLTRTRAERLQFGQDRVQNLECTPLNVRGVHPTGHRITVSAKHYVLAAGAIGSPALLMRSRAPDPHALLGKRTFLHPVNASAALMPDRVDAYAGAPQSVFSDQFLWPGGIAGPLGYKLEVSPMHPFLASAVLGGYGEQNRLLMERFPYLQATLALCRDGFHSGSPGGRVLLRKDNSPVLDYPFTDYLRDGMRRALLSMAELQFAAGAREIFPLHRDVTRAYTSWPQARDGIAKLDMEPLQIRVFSAHVMGGCPMGEDARHAVVNSIGRHHQIENLSVFDGSVFPTSIGTNPQLSIYATALKNTSTLTP